MSSRNAVGREAGELIAERELPGEHCGEVATSPETNLKQGGSTKSQTGPCLTHENQRSIAMPKNPFNVPF